MANQHSPPGCDRTPISQQHDTIATYPKAGRGTADQTYPPLRLQTGSAWAPARTCELEGGSHGHGSESRGPEGIGRHRSPDAGQLLRRLRDPRVPRMGGAPARPPTLWRVVSSALEGPRLSQSARSVLGRSRTGAPPANQPASGDRLRLHSRARPGVGTPTIHQGGGSPLVP